VTYIRFKRNSKKRKREESKSFLIDGKEKYSLFQLIFLPSQSQSLKLFKNRIWTKEI